MSDFFNMILKNYLYKQHTALLAELFDFLFECGDITLEDFRKAVHAVEFRRAAIDELFGKSYLVRCQRFSAILTSAHYLSITLAL